MLRYLLKAIDIVQHLQLFALTIIHILCLMLLLQQGFHRLSSLIGRESSTLPATITIIAQNESTLASLVVTTMYLGGMFPAWNTLTL